MLEVRAVPNLVDQLRDQRATARQAQDEILTRAASEGRDPSSDELAEYQAQAEVRAMATRGRRPTLSREAAETARAFRSAIFSKSPAPIEVYASELADIGPTTCPSPSWAGPAGCGSTPETR
jgi:hypothetical protein